MSHCQEPGEVEQVRLTCPQVCGIKTQVPWEADSENEIDMQNVYQEGLLGSTPREGVWEWGRGKKLDCYQSPIRPHPFRKLWKMKRSQRIVSSWREESFAPTWTRHWKWSAPQEGGMTLSLGAGNSEVWFLSTWKPSLSSVALSFLIPPNHQ